MRDDIKKALDLCRSVGLEPVLENSQYKVRHPDTGALLFNIHRTPSDPNWFWNIRRHLRKLGLLRKSEYKRHRIGGGQVKQGKPAIDMAALAIAQAKAASAGEHIPTLDDLEEDNSVLSRVTHGSSSVYSDDAIEEAIDRMAAKEDAPRIAATKQRLSKFLAINSDKLAARNNARLRSEGKRPQGDKGAVTEFVKTAMDIAPERKMWVWSSVPSGQQTIATFLNTGKASINAVSIIEATMDHLDGLQWGAVGPIVSRPSPKPKVVEPEPEPEGSPIASEPPEAELGEEPALVTRYEFESFASDIEASFRELHDAITMKTPVLSSDHAIRDLYAESLLQILAKEGSQISPEILDRLDKLAEV